PLGRPSQCTAMLLTLGSAANAEMHSAYLKSSWFPSPIYEWMPGALAACPSATTDKNIFPLWVTILTGPDGIFGSPTRFAPEATCAMPDVLGPTTRMPRVRLISWTSAERRRPDSVVEVKPYASTTEPPSSTSAK